MNFPDHSVFKKTFEREVVKIMRDFRVPGMSILIAKNGDPIYERSFGYRDIAGRKPATKDTLYGIASITKSMTCLAILQLHQAGKLNINDPVSNYLPLELAVKVKPITLHHLMSHSSGMPCLNSYEFVMVNQGYIANIPVLPLGNWDDFYLHVNDARDELIYPPNEKYFYWNGGFTLLSQIIEKVSGIPYEEFMKVNILQKLGMNRSSYYREDLERDQDVSIGYNNKWLETGFKRSPTPHLSSPFVSGAGGLNSSVKELTNYLQYHLNNGVYENNRIIDEKLLQEMYKPHNPNIKNLHTEFYGYEPNSKEYYGYGLKVYENYYGYTLVTHQGVSGVSGGNIGFIPELKISVVQLYNVSWLPSHLFHSAILLMLGKNPKEVMPFYIRRDHYKRLCGKYESYKGTTKISVEKKHGMLYLKDENWVEKVLYPLIPKTTGPVVTEFYIILPYGTLEILFTTPANGSITCDYERRLLHKKA